MVTMKQHRHWNSTDRIGTAFFIWCRDVQGVRVAAKVQPDHVKVWLQLKVREVVRYKIFAADAAAMGKMAFEMREIFWCGIPLVLCH